MIDKVLVIYDAITGKYQFDRKEGDYLKEDQCDAEIIITFCNGDVLILPTSGYYNLVIEDSLV